MKLRNRITEAKVTNEKIKDKKPKKQNFGGNWWWVPNSHGP